MALLNIGEDPWLVEYESCERLHRDIMEQLSFRQQELRTTVRYAQISSTIRLRLKQYNNEVKQLKEKVDHAALSNTITSDEVERRTRQVELLQSRGLHMQKGFEHHNMSFDRDRTHLLGAAGLSHWDDGDDQIIGRNSEEQSVDAMRTDQKRMLADQEKGLENLSQIISRQKNIANTISNEVDLQNEIIDDLGIHIDRTDARVNNETRNIGTIDRKDNTCVYWVIIVLLFISIITVASI